ncbi:HupE/UreJ family protein [Vibrio sp. WXL103]|uniref:HupE/UreJ family protein n=1 Tax=Vibrio sp. WXL103 TaxID=3450710 RepID=UPI003EC75683
MKTKFTAALALLATPSLALAHPGHDHHSFSAGLLHPVTGVDHLIMLVAFGLLVACVALTRTKALKLAGAGIASLMVGLFAGQALGFAAMVEPAIIASLFVVSLCLWQAFSPSTARVNVASGAAVAMLFFHGYAHGVEATGSVSLFAMGMLLSAAALMAAGNMVGQMLRSKWLSLGVASASAVLLLAA